MIGAYSSLALIVLASAVVGQAVLCFAAGSRRGEPAGWQPASPAVGIAALLVGAGIAARLPGHGVTAAVVLGAGSLGSLAYLRGRVRFEATDLRVAGAVVAITTAAASLPFALAGNVGVLGAGLVNDDMASHLLIADYVREPDGFVPSFVRGGYPIGPHAVVVAISEGGAGLVEVFSGFTLALAPLVGLFALGPLRTLAPPTRVLGASLVALPYLGASFIASGAFKEPLQALILLAFALLLSDLLASALDRHGPAAGRRVHPLRRIVPLALLAAAAVFNYSLPGLLWIGAVAVAVISARWFLLSPRPQLPADWKRRVAPYALGLAGILVLATAQEWSRIADFARLDALNPDRFGSDLGNLKSAISPFEALGIWPTGDYRTSATDAGPPAIVFFGAAFVAVAGLISGIRWARAEGLYAPAAALAAIIVVWALTAIFSTPYIAAKALAIAAPVVMVLVVGGLLSSRVLWLRLLAVVFVAGAALSTLLALRQAPVRPEAHSADLAAVRELVADEPVLFLGRDDFIGYELRGSGEITGVVTNFYSVEEVRGRFQKGEGGGEKFDLDAVFPATLDRFTYILATTGGPSSSPPPRLEPVVETDNYVLYENTTGVGRRKTLDEGVEPGAVLSCEGSRKPAILRGMGSSQIWRTEPQIAGPRRGEPDLDATDAEPASYELRVPAGRSLISLEYDSRRPLRVSSPELDLDASVDANLDFRGQTPTFPVAEVEVDRSTRATVTVEVVEPNLLARLLRAPNEAHLRSISATPLGVIERIPLRATCGQYVDWYRSR